MEGLVAVDHSLSGRWAAGLRRRLASSRLQEAAALTATQVEVRAEERSETVPETTLTAPPGVFQKAVKSCLGVWKERKSKVTWFLSA